MLAEATSAKSKTLASAVSTETIGDAHVAPDGVITIYRNACSRRTGIRYTHHQRRSSPSEYGYNVGCLEGVNPFDLEPVRLSDGANHLLDRKV